LPEQLCKGGNFWPEEAVERSQLPQAGATFLHTKAAVATPWDKTQAGPAAIQEQHRSIVQVSYVALHAFSLPGVASQCRACTLNAHRSVSGSITQSLVKANDDSCCMRLHHLIYICYREWSTSAGAQITASNPHMKLSSCGDWKQYLGALSSLNASVT